MRIYNKLYYLYLILVLIGYSNLVFSADIFTVKLEWASDYQVVDLDLYVKNPKGEIVNWSNRTSNWGVEHVRDDRGRRYQKSYEAFNIELNAMDCYATGHYEFHIDHYDGPTVNSTIFAELNGQIVAGPWTFTTSKKDDYNAVYYPADQSRCKNNSLELSVIAGGTGIGRVVTVDNFNTENGIINCSTVQSSTCINTINSSSVKLMAIPTNGTKFTGWGGACKGEKGNTCVITGSNMSIMVAAGFELNKVSNNNSSTDDQLKNISFMEIVGVSDTGGKIIRRISGYTAARKYNFITDMIAKNKSNNLRGMIIDASSHKVYKFAGKTGKALGTIGLGLEFGNQFLKNIDDFNQIIDSNDSKTTKSMKLVTEFGEVIVITLERTVSGTVNSISFILRKSSWINPVYWVDFFMFDGRGFNESIEFMDSLMNDMDVNSDKIFAGENIYNVITVTSDKLIESIAIMNN